MKSLEPPGPGCHISANVLQRKSASVALARRKYTVERYKSNQGTNDHDVETLPCQFCRSRQRCAWIHVWHVISDSSCKSDDAEEELFQNYQRWDAQCPARLGCCNMWKRPSGCSLETDRTSSFFWRAKHELPSRTTNSPWKKLCIFQSRSILTVALWWFYDHNKTSVGSLLYIFQGGSQKLSEGVLSTNFWATCPRGCF